MGNQWVRTDIDYGNRMAWVWIPDRLLARYTDGLRLSALAQEDKPEEMEKILYDVIEEVRPEWMGGVIFAIKYDLFPMRWKILFAHRNLSPIQNGMEFPEVPLISQ
jgi:hypothetical protein